MKKNQPKSWTNEKQYFFNVLYSLINFNSWDHSPQAVKKTCTLLDFSCNELRVQKSFYEQCFFDIYCSIMSQSY